MQLTYFMNSLEGLEVMDRDDDDDEASAKVNTIAVRRTTVEFSAIVSAGLLRCACSVFI